MDIRMLQEIGRQGPVSRPARKEHHLLAAAEVVDDSRSCRCGKRSICARRELGNLRCDT